MRSSLVWVVWLALGVTNAAHGFKILALLPHPGESHFHFFYPILKAAADAGSEVTVIGHFPMENVSQNYIDIPLDNPGSLINFVDLAWFANRPSFGHFMEFFMLNTWGQENCENALKSSAIQNLIKTRPPDYFDLIIMEQFNSDCMFGVTHLFNAPIIGLASCALMPWHYSRIGNPELPSLTPALFMGYSENMNFKQRIANWLAVYGMKMLYRFIAAPATNGLIHKYIGKDIPPVQDMVGRTSLIFVNQHYSLSGPKPVVPAVIELGGIHIEDAKPLEKDLQQFLESADHGVIYISWGSMIKSNSLPVEKREAILQALGQFKQKVLWKWEDESIPNQPANVFIRKWMPQRDILCHPKVRVFMTHGGLLGASEAAYCGVSVVSTPMYGDQFLNSAALVHRGMGSVLPYEDITKENVVRALKFALDPVTQSNAKKVSYSYTHRHLTPKEEAVWWIEHTIATKGVPLSKPHSVHMPWYVNQGLDIYAVIVAVEIVLIGSWIWCLRRFCCRSKTNASMTNHKVKTK